LVSNPRSGGATTREAENGAAQTKKRKRRSARSSLRLVDDSARACRAHVRILRCTPGWSSPRSASFSRFEPAVHRALTAGRR
jgi:hypothetical protein